MHQETFWFLSGLDVTMCCPFFFFFFLLFRVSPMESPPLEVPRLGVKSELQLPGYTTATAT